MGVARGARLGACAAAASIVLVASACSGGGTTAADDASTSRPSSSITTVDGGSSDGTGGAGSEGGEAAAPLVKPTAPLCTLAGPPAAAPGEVLVFDESFDGPLDPNRWNVETGYKGHDGILNTASAANAVPRDGALQVTTETNPSDADHPWVSGQIDTLNRYARTYGKIEFRARFPFAKGLWYALWGRPWSQPFPEIDIEVVNRPTETMSQVYFVNHWAAPPLPADARRSYAMFKQDVSDWHTYTVLWKPGSLEWLIDGVSKMTAQPQGVPNLPVYWIINGWAGGWIGNPTVDTPASTTFQVDYMRVYRVDGLIADPQIKVVNLHPDYASTSLIEVAIANFDEACVHVEMYDGGTLVSATSTAPYKFQLAPLTVGQAHQISFVATDGVRSTKVEVDATIH